VRAKYFSRRAIGLHFALLLWIAMCASAVWWQVGRAVEGNSLSFLYSIEWPVFGVLGVLGWYALLNLEQVTVDQQMVRREYEEKMRAQAVTARDVTRADEDPTLAAYNDHLARLSHLPKKRLWGHG
jgi:DNA-binding transcriptional regulator of glucitol operon